VRPIAEAKGVDVRWECPDASATIETDGLRVEQILLNLLGNAVKFTSTGCVTATMTRDALGVRVAVQDPGGGIAADDLERVFEDFYQAMPVEGGKTEGTGLGLAVSLRLAESIGARIDVESELGTGSVFTVSIPDRSS
jgi:signal transduction histidine kinase